MIAQKSRPFQTCAINSVEPLQLIQFTTLSPDIGICIVYFYIETKLLKPMPIVSVGLLKNKVVISVG